MMLRDNPNLVFKEDDDRQEYILVKPYRLKELCDLYGVSSKIFRKWIAPFEKEIGERNGWYYTVIQVEVILSRLGVPYRISGDI